MKALSIVLAGAWGAVFVLGCCKGADKTCPSRYAELPSGDQKGETTCSCPSGASGLVWGTDIYTTDSSICAAARHAGAMPVSGGPVKVSPAPGCPSYEGSTRNGVTSREWGAYETSFYFPGHGTGRCQALPAKCPVTFKSIPGVNASTELTCKCDASQIAGSVWGSDIYTQDSSICNAAVHAGEIQRSGGMVKVKAAAGCKTYKGTTRNGVTTGDWGPYESSFYFPNRGTGSCP